MITAKEALSLPSARLSDSDADAAKEILAEVDQFIRQNMTRIGCQMPIDGSRLNAIIADEVCRALKRQGFDSSFVKGADPSRVMDAVGVKAGVVQPVRSVVTSFFLAIAPDAETWKAVDDVTTHAQLTGANGVNLSHS